MKAAYLLLGFVFALGCKSAEEKACFGNGTAKDVVGACGQECDRKNEQACAKQTEVATDACMKKQDVEVCRWMCHYGKTGQDLYCAEYKKITGKEAE